MPGMVGSPWEMDVTEDDEEMRLVGVRVGSSAAPAFHAALDEDGELGGDSDDDDLDDLDDDDLDDDDDDDDDDDEDLTDLDDEYDDGVEEDKPHPERFEE